MKTTTSSSASPKTTLPSGGAVQPGVWRRLLPLCWPDRPRLSSPRTGATLGGGGWLRGSGLDHLELPLEEGALLHD